MKTVTRALPLAHIRCVTNTPNEGKPLLLTYAVQVSDKDITLTWVSPVL